MKLPSTAARPGPKNPGPENTDAKGDFKCKKVCSVCEQSQPLHQFHRRKSACDGHEGRCKGCRAPIRWRRNESGTPQPFNPDGVPRHGTCPMAKTYRRRK